ncbi:TetR family transcriptional regulator [Niastella yeongjuensis]|uniref:TetR family transcriptional regulator n=1 Tax=Niastella yeongjuensis TaxID=354355 RepID=A0A1V9E495_9BACT|nr:TetR/AcrR family transcriptional regulator [Niastella yeongjuensis]OQP40735.1 TetR family transcriptional regulator [Niastella yeongjuensis]SEP03209.1 transcriptional regulator, TetR family [Niastella yeongjuensis]
MPANNVQKEDIIQQQILQAAQQLFQKHGYQKVTMDDVAKAVGKGRSSLYYYYKNKDEVFDAVMDAEISDIIAEITRMVEQATTTEEKLRAFALTKAKLSRKRKTFFDALESGMSSDEISQYAHKKLNIKKKIRKEEIVLLTPVFVQGAKKGATPTLDPKERESIIFVFTSSLRGLQREFMLDNNYTRMEPAIDMLVRMTMLAIEQ